MNEPALVKDYVQLIRKELSGIVAPREAYQFAWFLFEHLRGYSKTGLMLHGDTKISHSEHLFLQKALEKLKNHEPIQYVLGKAYFYGLKFKVNTNVLVPRPETEELVDWLLKEVDKEQMKVLDVGTGSGCIAVAVKKNRPGAEVSAWDISDAALSVAAENAEMNHTEIHFAQNDILNVGGFSGDRFDIVVSNPPYVTNREKAVMDKNVLAYEPEVALYVPDDDSLLFYRAIARFALDALTHNGVLFFEINQALGIQVKEMLTGFGFRDIVLRTDLSGRDRMIRARLG